MALFKISRGSSTSLNNKNKVDGWCWFTTDDNKFYIDVGVFDEDGNLIETNRHGLNAFLADKASEADYADEAIYSSYLKSQSIDAPDYNNYYVPGVYYVTNPFGGYNYPNIDQEPLTGSPALLIVNGNYDEENDYHYDMVVQELIFAYGEKCSRIFNASGWQEWDSSKESSGGLTEPIVLTEISYGNNLPSTDELTEGQLFFLADEDSDFTFLPKGGQAGDYLVKQSDIDGDAAWQSLPFDIAEVYAAINTKATTANYSGTLTSGGWSSSAPYTQTITVNGILATDTPFVDVDLSNVSNQTAAIEAWGFVGRITASAANKITAYCYEEKPTVNLPMVIKVVR